MTKDDLATLLDRSHYPLRVSSELHAAARAAGLVIVYGASDDLMELRGAIDAECDAWEGCTLLLTPHGLFDAEACADQCRYFRDAQADAEAQGQTITALWDDGSGYSWTYQTTIPHATFTIFDEDDPYCRGIVFALADAHT